MINSSPEALGNQTYILSFLHEFPELKVQDHTANPEMLFPCLCHQILSKLAERQPRLLLASTTQGKEINRRNHTAYNALLFLTSATLLGTPSPTTSRAKTVWGMNPLTPQHRLNANRRRCISSSVTETSPKQTKGKISWNKHRKLILLTWSTDGTGLSIVTSRIPTSFCRFLIREEAQFWLP